MLYSAYFAEHMEEMTVDAQEHQGISVDELRVRARDGGIPLAELELTTQVRSLAYATQIAGDLTGDEALTKVAAALGPNAR